MNIKKIFLMKYRDERGWLVENEDKKLEVSMRHFLVSTLQQGLVRGQHYHKRKEEWFLIVKGRAVLVLKDIVTGETMNIELDGEKPQLVKIPSNVAHAIKNIGREVVILIAIVNERLDRNNADTYPYKVL